MLTHSTARARCDDRVVVLGGAGFIGKAVANRLIAVGTEVVSLSRQDMDFCSPDSVKFFRNVLKPGDVIVFAAAKAPCKNAGMLAENIVMMQNFIEATHDLSLAHLVYVSSDAVYADSDGLLNESSPAAPQSLHGVMHLARELMLRESMTIPFVVARPTLVYGGDDPHNGYGPNRFRRLAVNGIDISLFGEGEERRDHVHIDDLAELIAAMVTRRSSGVLNIATGCVVSFMEIAELVVRLTKANDKILSTARSGPMPHGGYRAFDPGATHAAFPDFVYTSIEEGLRKDLKLNG